MIKIKVAQTHTACQREHNGTRKEPAMELKVLCDCGQKFKFDVEPVNGRMPTTVNCPACQEDATGKANALLAEHFTTADAPAIIAPLPAPAETAAPGGLRINRTEPPAPTSPPPLPAAAAPGYPLLPVTRAAAKPKATAEFNMGLGILGAFLGSALGAGLMYAFFLWANFRFPLMGTGIGVLAGLGARILYKGTDTTLGILTAVIAVLATTGTLYLMYGDAAGIFILSIVVSGVIANRIAG
jgi:hypothetical protein